MRKELYKKLCFLFVLLCLPMTMYALPPEGIVVKGTVTDEMFKSGVVGASVTVKGTTIGAMTNVDGDYTITVPDKKAVLVFSYLGYVTQEVTVGEKTKIDIVMREDTQTVEEVVVIAYGTQNKGLVTSAISSISTKELVKTPVASVTNVLAGSVPGVSSIQSTGQPGIDEATIYVRGTGSLNTGSSAPLVLVDGVERPFSQIDPNEIESISVLKDASSTAVFGVRGANGVVLVTTRRGSVGKPTISVSSSLDLQQPISLVEQTNSYEYARFWNIRERQDKGSRFYTPEQIEAFRTGSDPIMYPSINWLDYMFRDVFLQSKNNINISGGSENVKYFVSMGYLYQNGLLKEMPNQKYDNNYRYNRYNYRANIDAKLSPTTTMKLGIGGYVGKRQEPQNLGENSSNNDNNPFVMMQIWTQPWAGPGFIDGVRVLTPQEVSPRTSENSRDGMSIYWGQGYHQYYNTNLNLDLDITQDLSIITKGLSVSVKGAYDNKFSINKNWNGGQQEYYTVRYKSYVDGDGLAETDPDFDKTYVFIPTGVDTPLNYADAGNSRAQSWYIEGRVNYERTFGDHRVSGLFLYNQSRSYYPQPGNAAAYVYIPHSYVGFVGRATYSYRNKYMADINLGYNGSENFAPGKTRYGLFPAFSAGWVVSEEAFMKRQTAVSFLKLRASWGRVGNDVGTSRFMYKASEWSPAGSYSFGTSNSTGAPAYGVSTEGNPVVTWETSDKQNYGIDARFLDDRLTLTADYFTEHRSGILTTPNSTPTIIATTLPNMNIGKVDNYGYEISLGWNDRAGKDFTYYINANVSFARNKIVYMDEVEQPYDYMTATGGSIGRRARGLLYKYERLYQYSDFIDDGNGNLVLNPDLPQPYMSVAPGDAMYADLNGDGIVDTSDRMLTGYGDVPEYTFGINAGFTWKGLSFSMQWTGATNADRLYDIEYRVPYTNQDNRGLLRYLYEGCWTDENQANAIYPRPARNSMSWNSQNSTLWLNDGSYLRLKSLNVGYTFSGQKLKQYGISTIGLTFSAYNLFTISPLKYLDPETYGSRTGQYPLVKLYSLGLNITF